MLSGVKFYDLTPIIYTSKGTTYSLKISNVAYGLRDE